MEELKVKDLKGYHKNPRSISKKTYEELRKFMDELGDISGIVHDIGTNEIIGGNQRSKILEDGKIEITEQFAKPTKQGTTALGYVIDEKGEKWNYRAVKWNEKQREKANIVANKISAEWDTDVLANEFDLTDLMDWGFEEKELYDVERIQTTMDIPDYGKIKFSEELVMLEQNYVVLTFDNAMDWQVAVDKLGLKKVKSNQSNAKAQKFGLGRVLKGAEVLKRIK